MVVNVSLDVAGTVITDWRSLQIRSSSVEYNSSSIFKAVLDTPFGRHKTDFTLGQTVTIKADKDTAAVTNIFVGILEKVQFRGQGTDQVLELSGRDFTARLMDATIEPTVFTDSEVSTIVKNILDNEVDDIGQVNVDTTDVTIPRISFNQQSVFEGLKQLADLARYYFFVDTDKDLNFKQRESVVSNVVLDNTNIVASTFDTVREGMANKAWVYGDRYLTGTKEILDVGSPFVGGISGSVFTLLNKPHNTNVETSASPGSLLKGGIFDFGVATSGTDYLVNFEDKQIILISGTDIGYNTIPASGGSIITNYDKETPIVKFGIRRSSIDAFGPKEVVLRDKSIKDPRLAIDTLQRILEQDQPIEKIELELKGWFTFNVGETVTTTLKDFDIDNELLPILNITYKFDAETVRNERIIKVRLKTKVPDITDEFTSIAQRLTALESQETVSSEFLTRLEVGLGSIIAVGSVWAVKARSLGSSFILGKGPHGVTGATFGGILGSIIESGINFLGDSRSGLTIQRSGGFDYTTL